MKALCSFGGASRAKRSCLCSSCAEHRDGGAACLADLQGTVRSMWCREPWKASAALKRFASREKLSLLKPAGQAHASPGQDCLQGWQVETALQEEADGVPRVNLKMGSKLPMLQGRHRTWSMTACRPPRMESFLGRRSMPATDDLQDTCQSTLQPALTGLSGPGAIAFVAGLAGQRACISIAVAHQGLITLVLSSEVSSQAQAYSSKGRQQLCRQKGWDASACQQKIISCPFD